MGYTTEFEGAMTLTPALTNAQVKEVNAFCEERHGGNINVFPGFPGFWCDWTVTDAGTKLTWNGSEKSYSMAEWLEELVSRFFKPWNVKVAGKMMAQGENRSDRWTMQVGEDQEVVCQRLPGLENLGITY